MRLIQFEITDFQCVRDSNSVPVGDITCLLGPNEAGKTALLRALYRLNPYNDRDGNFDVVEDYPRADLEEYEYAIETGTRSPATVARASLTLDADDLNTIYQLFGPDVLTSPVLAISKGYDNTRTFALDINEQKAFEFFLQRAIRETGSAPALQQSRSFADFHDAGQGLSPAEDAREFFSIAAQVTEQGLDRYLYLTYLRPRLPRFVYFDEFYQLRGFANLDALKQRMDTGRLEPSDYPMLGLLKLARLNIDQLLNPGRTQFLINKLDGASFHLNRQIFKYWSQNQNLQMRFDVRPGQPQDPEGARSGTNIWASVLDSRHSVATSLGARSRGFVWFFSFLAWYSELRNSDQPVILLLDEPGHSLHPRAQMDLIRFFEDELRPHHQLIYTTHSPFMVDRDHPDQLRFVESHIVDNPDAARSEQGTKVFSGLDDASADALLPVQGLSVELPQVQAPAPPPPPRAEPPAPQVAPPQVPAVSTSQHVLLVEDIADLLYIRALSLISRDTGRQGLGAGWTIVPVGGVENVPSYLAQDHDRAGATAALFGFRVQDTDLFNAFRARGVLAEDHVSTYVDFVGQPEAGIEDMFEPEFYVNLVNAAYRNVISQPIDLGTLNTSPVRLRDRVMDHFRLHPLPNMLYSHRRPARLLADNVDKLKGEISSQALNRFGLLFAWLDSMSPA